MNSKVELDPSVAKFIEENIKLIEALRWEDIYNGLYIPVGFTEAMLRAGIDPLYQGLTCIPYFFLRESSIESFIIPNHIESIGEAAFYFCTKLTNVIIGNNVTSIEYYAFSYCESLTSITIPSSVTNLGNLVFYHCDKLTEINYLGTKDEAITKLNVKDKNWRRYSSIQKVICTDGEIDLT